MRNEAMSKWFLTGFLAALLLSICVAGCSSQKIKPCCDSEDMGEFGDVQRSYCNDYAVAVASFLRAPDTESERTQRHGLFKDFLNGLNLCTDIVCIERAVDTSTLVPDFDAIFYAEHPHAQDLPISDEGEKLRLLLCGFEHGLSVSLK
jgi:hypothetical protein